jgi:ribosomal protein L11 methyltransferase
MAVQSRTRAKDGGLHCLQVVVPRPSTDAVRDALLARFPAGFEERESGKQLSFILYAPNAAAIEGMRSELTAALSKHAVRLRAEHQAVDWQAAWMAALGPQPLTKRTTVIPVKRRLRISSTSRGVEPKGAVRKLYLLQQAAFGFGEHVTTRLMAARVERLVTDAEKSSVLDVGAGTGVLGILAALRGARAVKGIDIDLPSVEAANANAALNGVSRRCRFTSHPLQKISERFDIVLANLDFQTLQKLSKALRRVSRRGTTLLLSGILSEDVPALNATFTKLGFELREQSEREDWALLEYRL